MPNGKREPERIETLVIGGGQAGLSVGYHLARRGLRFLILDANERIGDVWRNRWDSLRLFTPARFDGLPGMKFPAPAHTFPTKDEMADYLEAYACRFDLPVRLGVEVDGLSRLTRQGTGSTGDEGFLVAAGEQRFQADNVVVSMANYQKAKVPDFAHDLDPEIFQLHSIDYRNPQQLRAGHVLIVGAGNSGAEIAMDVASQHQTWVSGRDVGQLPFRIDGTAGRLFLVRLVLRFLFHRVLTVDTPLGRKARPHVTSRGGPLIRMKRKHMAAAGISHVPKTVGVGDGLPQLDNGEVLDVANVIWCTGFHPGFSWIDLPIHGDKEPTHERGIVANEPGFYFVGLHFLYSLSSGMIHGAHRDADRIARAIAARSGVRRSASRTQSAAVAV